MSTGTVSGFDSSSEPLSGLTVLVVEDDFFIADDLASVLGDAGARVIGPVPNIAAAERAIADTQVAAAVLDINLSGTPIYPLADRLLEMGVRLVFATGYEGHLIPPRFAGSPRLVKPIATEHLIEVLADGARRPTPAGC